MLRWLLITFFFILAGCGGYRDGGPPRKTSVAAPAPPPSPTPAAPPPVYSVDSTSERLIVEDRSPVPAPAIIDNRISTATTVDSQLSSAKLVFLIPGSANIKEEITAKLLVSTVLDGEQLAVAAGGGGKRTAADIKVSKILIAKLSAPDFKVEAITPEEQALSEADTSEWRWRLRPASAGTYTVNLTVVAVVEVAGQKLAPRHIKTFDHQVDITITSGQLVSGWLEKWWQWIVSTILAPLAVWAWKSWRASKTKS